MKCFPADGDDADTLTSNANIADIADIAMHDVKNSGRGELRCFDPTTRRADH